MKKTQKSQEPEMILENRIVRIQKAREWKRGLFELLVFLAVVYVTFTYIIGVGSRGFYVAESERRGNSAVLSPGQAV